MGYRSAAPAPRANASPNKLHRYPFGNEPRLVGPIEKELHRPAPALSVVDGPLIDVHPYKRVGPLIADSPVELLGVRQCGRPMLQSIHDAGAKVPRNLLGDLAAQVTANGVSSEWEWQPRVL